MPPTAGTDGPAQARAAVGHSSPSPGPMGFDLEPVGVAVRGALYGWPRVDRAGVPFVVRMEIAAFPGFGVRAVAVHFGYLREVSG